MAPPTNTSNTESNGAPTAWLPDPRTGRMREYTHAEVLAALLAGDPEEERREREEAEWLEREESQRREREEAQRRERELAERRAREQEQRSSRKRGHTHAEMLAALLGDSEREGREPKQRRDQAQRGDHNPTESRPCEHEKQPSSPPGTKKRRERTHADMLAALLGDPSEERREREQAERRVREEAQRRDSKRAERKAREPAGEEEHSDEEEDDDIGPISFAGGPLLEGMGLPTLDEAMQKLELRAKRQEEKEAAKKKSEEDAAKQKVEAEPAKQEAGAAKEGAAKKEGPLKKATTVNSSRNHEDMGEARRMPDCRCSRCDPCDCDDCHYAHYPTYRRKGLGKW
ncbi:hypothetical protein K523DRAFT_375199 [Schizophyllum commune Tattone D]|nr:hypothetical protein K523DRAFT_375199 [Schizophyllum commune Tattone D]